jgi:hypothetical protein
MIRTRPFWAFRQRKVLFYSQTTDDPCGFWKNPSFAARLGSRRCAVFSFRLRGRYQLSSYACLSSWLPSTLSFLDTQGRLSGDRLALSIRIRNCRLPSLSSLVFCFCLSFRLSLEITSVSIHRFWVNIAILLFPIWTFSFFTFSQGLLFYLRPFYLDNWS